MARKATWPPLPKPHASGRLRLRWRGKDHYLAPNDPAAYAALLARLAAEDAAAPATPASGPSVAAAVLAYVEGPASRMTTTQGTLVRRSLSVLVRVAGGMEAARFGAGDLDRVRCAMLDNSWRIKGEKGGPWSPRTADACCGHLRAAWRWLELRGLVPEGRWGALRALKALAKPARPRRCWTTRQVITAASAIKLRSASRLILLVQLWSGARPGEVRGMLWSEIDTSAAAWVWRPLKHKTAWRGHERTIMLGPKAQAVLRLARRRWPRRDKVFPDISVSTYTSMIKRAGVRAGLKGFRAYDARHSAKDRITRLMGLEAAKQALGHQNLSMTERYGSGQDARLAAEAALRAG